MPTFTGVVFAIITAIIIAGITKILIYCMNNPKYSNTLRKTYLIYLGITMFWYMSLLGSH